MELTTGAAALGTASLNTYTGILNKVEDYFSKVLLMIARESNEFEKYASLSNTLPTKQGIRHRWFRLSPLTAANELQEGVNPPPKSFNKEHIFADVKEYGDYVEISSWAELTETDPTLNSYSEEFGKQAALTWDLLIATEVFAGTNIHYANSKVARTGLVAGDVLADADLVSVVNTLNTSFAKEVTEIVEANQNYATTPIGRAFIGFSHRNMTPKIAALSNFTPYFKYPNQSTVMVNEIGSIAVGGKTIRFIESSNTPVFTNGSGVSVYPTLIIGKEYFGILRLAGLEYQMMLKSKDIIGGALSRFGTMGWVGSYAAKRLNENFGLRIENTLV